MTSTPADLLQVMRETTKTAIAVEVRKLAAVIEWCVLHEVDDEEQASFGDHGIPLAGDGAPWVSEFAVMELGTAMGCSTDSAKKYVGAALEVCYRLPRVWERVAAGDLPFWKARFIAEHTMALPAAGAAFVDQRVAFCAHKIGYAELQRQIDAALLRFDPEAGEKARLQDSERRRFDIHKDAVTPAGTVDVNGTLDLPDALDLEAAVSARAAELRDLGCEESLNVRRSMAVGDLARGQATLDYDKPQRQVVVHVHGDTVFGNPNPEANVGRCDNTRTPVLAETIRQWCGNPDVTIVVKPVRDLADHLHVASYEVPDRLVEQDSLVDHHCVFPWCTRPARSCDIDHVVPHNRGGPTCSCNTAPLCRAHHRLKTHGGWTYDVLDRGTYLWRSPNNQLFRRDHTGTEPLDALRRRLNILERVLVTVVDHNPLVMSVETLGGRSGPFVITADVNFVASLNDEELAAAIAHELGHVWIYTHHPYLQTERLANDVALRVISPELLVPVYEKVWKRIGARGNLADFISLDFGPGSR